MLSKKRSILINTENFNKKNFYKIEFLKKKKFDFIFNNSKKKISKKYLKKFSNKNVVGIIADLEMYDKETLNFFKELKAISRFGIGINNLDLNELKKNKIDYEITRGSTPYVTAEYALTLVLNLLRKVNKHDLNLKNKKWQPEIGNSLYGKTLGILGYGKVGKIASKIFKKLGCKVLIHDKLNIKNKITIKDLFKKCDIISIHLNLTEKTKNIVNQSLLKFMKKNAILVNTSRGEIIDENDLYKFLKKEKFSGAALDCFSNEPYFGKLRNLNNVILSPHVASNTIECRNQMEIESSKNLYKLLKKNKLIDE